MAQPDSSEPSTSSGGKIVYAGVWDGDHLWTQWFDDQSSVDVDALKQLSRSLFERIDRSYDHKKPFAPYQGFVFQYLVEDERAFLCASTEGLPQRISYSFLEKIKAEYFMTYVDTQKVSAFQKFLKEQAKLFSESPDIDPLRALKKKVDDVIIDMAENYTRLGVRDDELNRLQDTSILLAESSQKLHDEAKSLRCKLCRDNLKATVAVSCTCVALIVVVILIIVFLVAGGSDSNHTSPWYTTQSAPISSSTSPGNFTSTFSSSSSQPTTTRAPTTTKSLSTLTTKAFSSTTSKRIP